jgi:hypothetical protein
MYYNTNIRNTHVKTERPLKVHNGIIRGMLEEKLHMTELEIAKRLGIQLSSVLDRVQQL